MQQKNRLTLALLITSFVVLAVSGIYAAYDPSSPAQTHNALTDIDAIRENTNQLRKHESGTTPSNLARGILWDDSTNNLLKFYTGTVWHSIWDVANGKIATDGVQSSSIKAGTTAVVVSSNDTTKGYLNGKLVAESGVTTLTENNDGGAETLTIGLASGSISAAKLASDSVTDAKIQKSFTAGTQIGINPGATWTPSAGYYVISASTDMVLQVKYSGSWYSGLPGVGSFFTDGTNVRMINNGGSPVTVYYLKLQ